MYIHKENISQSNTWSFLHVFLVLSGNIGIANSEGNRFPCSILAPLNYWKSPLETMKTTSKVNYDPVVREIQNLQMSHQMDHRNSHALSWLRTRIYERQLLHVKFGTKEIVRRLTQAFSLTILDLLSTTRTGTPSRGTMAPRHSRARFSWKQYKNCILLVFFSYGEHDYKSKDPFKFQYFELVMSCLIEIGIAIL